MKRFSTIQKPYSGRFNGATSRRQTIGGLLLYLLFIVALGTHPLPAQEKVKPYILSERVGEEIDSTERDYFCLFPGIDGFRSARFFTLPDGRMELVVSRRSDGNITDTVLSVAPEIPRKLQEIIDNFEVYCAGKRQISNARILKEFFRSPCRGMEMEKYKSTRKRNGHPVITVSTIDGLSLVGKLLYVCDTVLVLWASNSPYAWRQVREFSLPINANAIENIVIQGKSSTLKGAVFGCVIGAGLGALFGYGEGDDPEGWFSMSAEEKAKLYSILLSIPGAILGGMMGASYGDLEITIEGNKETFQKLCTKLKNDAIFPALPPPELRRVMGEKTGKIFPHPPEKQTNESVLEQTGQKKKGTSPSSTDPH